MRQCNSRADNPSNPKARCDNKIYEGRRIHFLQHDPGFALMMSSKARRELILVHETGYGTQSEQHLNNEALSAEADAWEAVLKVMLRLSARAEMAFGDWEAEQHRNKAIKSCHAHVHLFVDQLNWDEMLPGSTQEPVAGAGALQADLVAKMRAVTQPAVDHRLEDASFMHELIFEFKNPGSAVGQKRSIPSGIQTRAQRKR